MDERELGGKDRRGVWTIWIVLALLLVGASAANAAPGALDPSFSGDGYDVLPAETSGNALAIQPDGKIVVAGHAAKQLLVARYGADGTLDRTFSDDGRLTTDLGGFALPVDLALLSGGRILVVANVGDKR